jgi:hypothetical protein
VSDPRSTVLGLADGFARRLRFPYLFWVTVVLFLLDLLIPDLIPFADEILLGLATLLLGSWKKRRPQPPAGSGEREPAPGRIIDVDPERGE